MATTINISAQSGSGWVKVFIDETLVIDGNGSAGVDLENGQHYLTYFVQGNSGTAYQVEITAPSEEAWKVAGKMKSNHTTGQHGIIIGD